MRRGAMLLLVAGGLMESCGLRLAHCNDPGGCKLPLVCHQESTLCVWPETDASVDGGNTATDGGGGTDGTDGGCANRVCSGTCCGSACVDLVGDRAHCGGCFHDCGRGASCALGTCAPAELTPTPQEVRGGVAVDDAGIYFGDGTRLLTCPLDGCTLSPRQLWSASYVRSITAGGGVVAWVGVTSVGRSSIETCVAADCTSRVVASGNAVTSVDSPRIAARELFYYKNISSAPDYAAHWIACWPIADGGCEGMTSGYRGKPPFAADETSLAYFPTAEGSPATFVACPFDSTSCSPIGLMGTSGVIDIAASNGTLFSAWSGSVGPTTASMIQACALSGCTTATKLATTPVTENVVDIVADSSGVYWAFGGDNGSIWMCPGQACAGGARRIAERQANPFSLQLQGNYVYWGAQGQADGGGTSGLRRVAKPLP